MNSQLWESQAATSVLQLLLKQEFLRAKEGSYALIGLQD